jgi:Acetyltransferase (GNAT) domain
VSPPSRHIPRKRVPEIRVLRHPVEKRLVKPGVRAFAEVAGIWVRQLLDEAARVTETVDLVEPELDIALPQEREQGVVLRQRPWQLDHVADEERPRRAAAAGLWFIRVAQRHRAVVLERELTKPIRHPVRRRRPEPDGAEGRRRFAKEFLLRLELGPRREKRAIVPDAVHADLEASSSQLTEDAVVDLVPGLHHVERRAQAALLLHVGDPQRVPESGAGLHVMGQCEGSSGSTGPEPAKSDLLTGSGEGSCQRCEQIARGLIIRPAGEIGHTEVPDQRPPERQLHSARNGAADPIERCQRPRGKRRPFGRDPALHDERLVRASEVEPQLRIPACRPISRERSARGREVSCRDRVAVARLIDCIVRIWGKQAKEGMKRRHAHRGLRAKTPRDHERRPPGATLAAMNAGRVVASRLAEIGIWDEEYAAFVARHEAATPFHLPSWIGVIASSYGFAPSVFCLRDEHGSIRAASPGLHVGGRLRGRRWVSVPFTDACAPLADDAAAAEAFAAALDRHRRERGLKSIEIRGEVGGNAGTKHGVGYRHVIPLTADEEAVFRRFSKRTRQAVKRARREGLVVQHERDLRVAHSSFWRLHCATRRKLGVPVQPRAFFDAIWHLMVERGYGYVLSAYAGSRPVASAVFLEYGPTAVYKFSASNPELTHLPGPSAVLWEGVRTACEKGQTRLDLGRTEFAHEGLRLFKRGWGSAETTLAYTFLGKGAPAESRGSEGAVGRVIQRSPTIVARTIGRVAYRWTA